MAFIFLAFAGFWWSSICDKALVAPTRFVMLIGTIFATVAFWDRDVMEPDAFPRIKEDAFRKAMGFSMALIVFALASSLCLGFFESVLRMAASWIVVAGLVVAVSVIVERYLAMPDARIKEDEFRKAMGFSMALIVFALASSLCLGFFESVFRTAASWIVLIGLIKAVSVIVDRYLAMPDARIKEDELAMGFPMALIEIEVLQFGSSESWQRSETVSLLEVGSSPVAADLRSCLEEVRALKLTGEQKESLLRAAVQESESLRNASVAAAPIDVTKECLCCTPAEVQALFNNMRCDVARLGRASSTNPTLDSISVERNESINMEAVSTKEGTASVEVNTSVLIIGVSMLMILLLGFRLLRKVGNKWMKEQRTSLCEDMKIDQCASRNHIHDILATEEDLTSRDKIGRQRMAGRDMPKEATVVTALEVESFNLEAAWDLAHLGRVNGTDSKCSFTVLEKIPAAVEGIGRIVHITCPGVTEAVGDVIPNGIAVTIRRPEVFGLKSLTWTQRFQVKTGDTAMFFSEQESSLEHGILSLVFVPAVKQQVCFHAPIYDTPKVQNHDTQYSRPSSDACTDTASEPSGFQLVCSAELQQVNTTCGPYCFLRNTAFKTPGNRIALVQNLVPGSKVLLSDGITETSVVSVDKIPYQKKAPYDVIKLITPQGTFEVSAGHPIAVPGSSGTKEARCACLLQPGDIVFVGRKEQKLIKVVAEKVGTDLFKVSFFPDLPVEAFPFPSFGLQTWGEPCDEQNDVESESQFPQAAEPPFLTLLGLPNITETDLCSAMPTDRTYNSFED